MAKGSGNAGRGGGGGSIALSGGQKLKFSKKIEIEGTEYVKTEKGWFLKYKLAGGETQWVSTDTPRVSLSNVELLEGIKRINPMTLRPGFEMDFVHSIKRYGKAEKLSEKQLVSIKRILRERKIPISKPIS